MLHAGRLVPDRLILSHEEQLERLAKEVPEAVEAAVLAGDPCLDRIQASIPLRHQYRYALGADEDTTVVVVSSTWRAGSLINTWPTLFRQLQAELPLDSYLVVGVLHPHIWFAHGQAQVRSWLAECERAGLRLIRPEEGWQAALVAADVVIGDYGAVTCYATALDVPLALAAFAEEAVAAGSPVDLLGQCAPGLDTGSAIRPQLEQVVSEYRSGRYAPVANLITSQPGESGQRLRTVFYELMKLEEPSSEVPVPPLPIMSVCSRLGRSRATAAFVDGCVEDDNTARVRRLPADVLIGRTDGQAPPDGAHLVVGFQHPIRSLRTNADILFCHEEELTTSVRLWWSETLRESPGTTLAAMATTSGECLLAGRGIDPVRITPAGTEYAAAPDPMIWASVYYLWLISGGKHHQPPTDLVARTASGEYRARQEPCDPPEASSSSSTRC